MAQRTRHAKFYKVNSKGCRNDDNVETKLGRRVTIDESGCWIVDIEDDWDLHRVVTHRDLRMKAHVVAYETFTNDAVPDGSVVAQTCGVKACVKPDHLTVRSLRLDVVNYRAAHARMERDHGPARTKVCVDCGQDAAHWSYNHTDPNHLVDDRGCNYSLDASHYAPRCARCHGAFDVSPTAIN